MEAGERNRGARRGIVRPAVARDKGVSFAAVVAVGFETVGVEVAGLGVVEVFEAVAVK
jgi:hypothetical protein